MKKKWIKRIGWLVVLTIVAGAAVWFAWPRPVQVDLAVAAIEPLEVTVDDEGRSRVRHVYTVSAPVAGRVLRISLPESGNHASLHRGDEVIANETVVATMRPVDPSLIDIRSRRELEAAAVAAQAAVTLAEAEMRRSTATLEFSRGELRRAQSLARSSTISPRALDEASLAVETGEAALASAEAHLDVRRSEHAAALARLADPADMAAAGDAACCIQVRAPISGRVLNVIQESEAIVPAGSPLVEIGDPADLEIVVDLLSAEAVRIEPGAPARIEGWGGPPLNGQVRRVDPAGFVKISALGIEERRVSVVIGLTGPPEVWDQLGHDFRVIVHVTAWSTDEALVVPISALFRNGDDWAVFVAKDGRARTAIVDVGNRNQRMAEIISGLEEGDVVIVHPSDRVADGVAVASRQSGS